MEAVASSEGEPWVLRLGNYLSNPKDSDAESEPWAVSLGKYLNERKPGPWSLIANKKPQDPLALRLGTFLNETKPLGLGNIGFSKGDGSEESDAPAADPMLPMVLRLGNYLNSSGEAASTNASAAAASVDGVPPTPPRAAYEPAAAPVAELPAEAPSAAPAAAPATKAAADPARK